MFANSCLATYMLTRMHMHMHIGKHASQKKFRDMQEDLKRIREHNEQLVVERDKLALENKQLRINVDHWHAEYMLLLAAKRPEGK